NEKYYLSNYVWSFGTDPAGRAKHSANAPFISAPIPATPYSQTFVHNCPNQMTTFYIKNTFSITERQSIVFEGEIVKGTINNGQKIKLGQTNNHPTIELTISSVEFIDHLVDKVTNVGLIVKIEKSADLTDLLNYSIKD